MQIDSGAQVWTSGLCSKDCNASLGQRFTLEPRSCPVASVVKILMQVQRLMLEPRSGPIASGVKSLVDVQYKVEYTD